MCSVRVGVFCVIGDGLNTCGDCTVSHLSVRMYSGRLESVEMLMLLLLVVDGELGTV